MTLPMTLPMMRAVHAVVVAVFASSACGGDPLPVVDLVLGATYDVTGVARVLPDGQTPSALKPLRFRYEMLAASAGRLSGVVVSAQGRSDVTGNYEPKDAQFTIAPFSLALTGTVTEQIVELGGVGFDSKPSDGRVDDMSGFLRAEIGRSAVEAFTIAASPIANRPAKPDVSKIAARSTGLGRAQASGAAGAVASFTGVELFVHGLAIAPPAFTLVQAREDGSFTVDLDANPGDLVVVRGRTAGIAGEADVFAVSQ